MKATHLLSAANTGATAFFRPLLSSHCQQARRPSTPRLIPEARRTAGSWWCLLVRSKTIQMKRLKLWTSVWGTVGIFGVVLPAWSACFFCVFSPHFPWLHAYFDHLWSTSGKQKVWNKLLRSEPIWDSCSKSTWIFIFSSSTSGFVDSPSSASHLFISLTYFSFDLPFLLFSSPFACLWLLACIFNLPLAFVCSSLFLLPSAFRDFCLFAFLCSCMLFLVRLPLAFACFWIFACLWLFHAFAYLLTFSSCACAYWHAFALHAFS